MPALAAGTGVGGAAGGGIGGDPGAVEAGAAAAARAATAIEQAGRSVSGHGDTVVANWRGSASLAAHERIRLLGENTTSGGGVLGDLPAVLSTYAGALRAAQARYAAGQAAAAAAGTALGAATAQVAAVAAEATVGDDPALAGRQRAAATAVAAATEAGAAAGDEMSAAVADEQVANAVAAAAVEAITAQMGVMRTTNATPPAAPSPNAAERGGQTPTATALPGLHTGVDPRGDPLPAPPGDAQVTAERENEDKGLDRLQTGMDVAGMIPVVGVPIDVVNAGLYALRGQWGNAALAGAGAIPIAGDAATAVRLGIKGKHAIDATEAAAKAERVAKDTTAAAGATRAVEPSGPPVPTGVPMGPLGPASPTSRTALDASEQAARDARVQTMKNRATADRQPGAVAKTYTSPPSSSPMWPGVGPGDPKPMSGPMYVHPPKNPTAEQIVDAQRYARDSEVARQDGFFNEGGRVATEGELRQAASKAAAYEKAHPSQGVAYRGVAGHVPDATWSNEAVPFSWLDEYPSVNSSVGAQAQQYPLGYKPTEVLGPLDQKYLDHAALKYGDAFRGWEQ